MLHGRSGENMETLKIGTKGGKLLPEGITINLGITGSTLEGNTWRRMRKGLMRPLTEQRGQCNEGKIGWRFMILALLWVPGCPWGGQRHLPTHQEMCCCTLGMGWGKCMPWQPSSYFSSRVCYSCSCTQGSRIMDSLLRCSPSPIRLT